MDETWKAEMPTVIKVSSGNSSIVPRPATGSWSLSLLLYYKKKGKLYSIFNREAKGSL